jgi:hypothetical protein
MFERYKRVSKARDAVLGKYHPASIWSASRVAWGTFHRLMEGFENIRDGKTIFDDLADRQVHGRSISPEQQKREVWAIEIGAAMFLGWRDLEDRLSRLRELATEVLMDSLDTDALRVDYIWQILLFNSIPQGIVPQRNAIRTRLWNIFNTQTEELGPSHCDTLETLAGIGELSYQVREYNEVATCWERVQTTGARLGPAHIIQARCMYRLAQCYYMEKSLPLNFRLRQLDMAWEACRVVYGESHYNTGWLAERRLEYRQIQDDAAQMV